MLLTILIIALVLALVGGGLGHDRLGYLGWSPLGIIMVILLILLLTGHFR